MRSPPRGPLDQGPAGPPDADPGTAGVRRPALALAGASRRQGGQGGQGAGGSPLICMPGLMPFDVNQPLFISSA